MAPSAEQVKKEQQKLIAQREARERREREAQQAAAGAQPGIQSRSNSAAGQATAGIPIAATGGQPGTHARNPSTGSQSHTPFGTPPNRSIFPSSFDSPHRPHISSPLAGSPNDPSPRMGAFPNPGQAGQQGARSATSGISTYTRLPWSYSWLTSNSTGERVWDGPPGTENQQPRTPPSAGSGSSSRPRRSQAPLAGAPPSPTPYGSRAPSGPSGITTAHRASQSRARAGSIPSQGLTPPRGLTARLPIGGPEPWVIDAAELEMDPPSIARAGKNLYETAKNISSSESSGSPPDDLTEEEKTRWRKESRRRKDDDEEGGAGAGAGGKRGGFGSSRRGGSSAA